VRNDLVFEEIKNCKVPRAALIQDNIYQTRIPVADVKRPGLSPQIVVQWKCRTRVSLLAAGFKISTMSTKLFS